MFSILLARIKLKKNNFYTQVRAYKGRTHNFMTKQEETFEAEILPIIEQLSNLCKEHKMPFTLAVQVEALNSEKRAVESFSMGENLMAFPLRLGHKITSGVIEVRAKHGGLKFYFEDEDELKRLSDELNSASPAPDKNLETLDEHIAHCEECREMANEATLDGIKLSEVYIQKHGERDMEQWAKAVQNNEIMLVAPKKNIIL